MLPQICQLWLSTTDVLSLVAYRYKKVEKGGIRRRRSIIGVWGLCQQFYLGVDSFFKQAVEVLLEKPECGAFVCTEKITDSLRILEVGDDRDRVFTAKCALPRLGRDCLGHTAQFVNKIIVVSPRHLQESIPAIVDRICEQVIHWLVHHEAVYNPWFRDIL